MLLSFFSFFFLCNLISPLFKICPALLDQHCSYLRDIKYCKLYNSVNKYILIVFQFYTNTANKKSPYLRLIRIEFAADSQCLPLFTRVEFLKGYLPLVEFNHTEQAERRDYYRSSYENRAADIKPLFFQNYEHCLVPSTTSFRQISIQMVRAQKGCGGKNHSGVGLVQNRIFDSCQLNTQVNVQSKSTKRKFAFYSQKKKKT